MELTKVTLQGSVNNALQAFRFEILPDEVRQNSLSRWIVSFDAIDSETTRRRSTEHEEFDDPFASLTAQLVENIVAYNVNFYFASLFHIGRQWRVSEQALEVIGQASLPRNLSATVAANADFFAESFSSLELTSNDYEAVFTNAIQSILSAASQQHSRSLERARQIWRAWLDEVEDLYRLVQRSSEEYNAYRFKELNQSRERFTFLTPYIARLMEFSFQSKRVYQFLNEDNVRFRQVTNQSPLSNWLTASNILSLLMSGIGQDEVRGLSREIRQLFAEQSSLIDKQRYAPITQAIEQRLLAEFGDQDPFDKYIVLRSPPDYKLHALWRHCKLPKNELFFYAQNWIDSLDQKPNYINSPLLFKSNLTEKDIDSYSRALDSWIKREWCLSEISVGETEREMMQRLFEGWIAELAKGALYPTRERKGPQQWTMMAFRELVSRIVTRLNKIGYLLSMPSNQRFSQLWKSMESKNSYWKPTW